jgi:hypothetical protein
MSATSSEGALLDAGAAAFLCRAGISITAAASDAGNVARIGRCLGCRVAADRTRVTVFIASSQYQAFFEALGAAGRIAVVFSYPGTHQTMQLKGGDAQVGPLAPGDRETVARHVDNFVDELGRLGYPRDVVRAYHWSDPDELRAVTFTPTAAFEQTPGPGAGAPLRRSA